MSDTEVLHPDPAVSIPQGPEFVSRSDPASTSAVTQEPTSARQQDTTHAAPHAPASSHATESESMQQQESGSFDVESQDNQRSGYHDDESTRKDIAHFTSRQVPDAVKHYFIQNRQPNANFTFPSKIYKDKRRKDGQMKRYCCREWFEKFEFISYSESTDGLFCLACVLFPDTEHRRPKLLVKDPYRNWKDAVSDLKTHTCNEYHINSTAKLNAFVTTFSCPSKRIDANIESSNSERISKNREILKSIVKSIVFCGRQGISLRGHRDDDTTTSLIKGNFKALLQFRCESGDLTLKDHLENCAKNASYTSKVSQNDILDCIKYYIQKCIVSEINQQKIGPNFGFQCDEVTDNSNWEQLGIVLRYTVDNKPVERLLEFVELEKTTGEAICESIVKALTDAGLDVQLCRSQTMDGAGNMSGKQAGCAARFQSLSPKAQYHYCSSHDLNLALCKCCNIKEIHVMLDTLTQLGLFFKYSPKRSRRLEEAVTEANSTRPKSEQISKSKFHVFCETRWVEKQTTLRDFSSMYAPIVECLEAIGQLESGWDTKAVTDAYGLLKKITDSTFIVCFQTVLHMFGYVIGISSKLQGTSLDIIQAYEMVTHVKTSVSEARNTDYKDVYTKASTMAQKAGLDSLQMPRRCGRQTQRSNVPADNVEQYYERAVFLPFVDSMSQQLNLRFNTMTQQACLAFCLLPNNIASATQESMLALLDFYRDDMPQPDMFAQEVQLWKQTWRNTENKPSTIVETLTETCQHMYPNISKVLTLLLLTSVTSAGVERSNSSLKFIKNPHRSTMGQSRFNALMLLFIHRDIKLDIEEIVNIYARKYPRRMLLIDPLCE